MVATGTSRGADAAPVPGSACNVFPADNIWNTDISNLPVNTSSATWIASTTPASGLMHPDFGRPPYGMPFNVVSSSHPTASITFDYASESDPGPYPWGNDLAIEGPTDSHMLVVNKDTCNLYETFATNIAANHAGSGAIFNLGSDALRQAGWTSADAAGLPILPGLVRFDEVQAGSIGHAIRFTVHNTNDNYLWPARHHAGINDPTLPPMGARFRLKKTFDISGFGAEAQVVLTAFKHYGLIVADNGSDWYFQGTEDSSWDDQIISDLKKVPVNQFEAVDESSLMVNPDSAQAGTAPLAPVAPSANPRAASATVTWTPPPNGGQPITGYTIVGSPSGTATASGNQTSVVVFGLNNGTTYTFKVAATNVIGTGPFSPSSNPVTPNARLAAQSSPASGPARAPVAQSSPPPAPPIRIAVPGSRGLTRHSLATSTLNGLKVTGNLLTDASGNPVMLRGFNRSGTEYACAQGWGVFDGPSDPASVQAMASWQANYVRVLLNEDCWLGINGVNASYSGANYQNAIVNYVNLLNQDGFYVEISLIWAAPGSNLATNQPAAPDFDHSIALWSSVASTFKNNPNVFFGVWGETSVSWSCFLNGCSNEATYGPGNAFYQTAGTQSLVNAVRAAGATQPIAVPGINFANDLSQWLAYEPSDVQHQLVAEAHVYGNNTCGALDGGTCLNNTVAPLTAHVPVVFGETGETYNNSECTSANMQLLLPWADAHNIGYAAWTWDAWGDCLSLISSYDGTPNNVAPAGAAYGPYVHSHLLAVSHARLPANQSSPGSVGPRPVAQSSPPPSPRPRLPIR
ncbi:MAG TPA: cellulase family glycosylhydrolase [Candidatus Dormibacteraeota bacterium]|nr:cellulase family glycosylhydrolase [Candidatus Dormibacteraeota bacterium]